MIKSQQFRVLWEHKPQISSLQQSVCLFMYKMLKAMVALGVVWFNSLSLSLTLKHYTLVKVALNNKAKQMFIMTAATCISSCFTVQRSFPLLNSQWILCWAQAWDDAHFIHFFLHPLWFSRSLPILSTWRLSRTTSASFFHVSFKISLDLWASQVFRSITIMSNNEVNFARLFHTAEESESPECVQIKGLQFKY